MGTGEGDGMGAGEGEADGVGDGDGLAAGVGDGEQLGVAVGLGAGEGALAEGDPQAAIRTATARPRPVRRAARKLTTQT